jgi:hypothetical protein
MTKEVKTRSFSIAAAILAAMVLWLFSLANAAGILKITMDELLQFSGFVFEGRVLSIESRLTGPRRIHTFVTCEILEIIKGEFPEKTITLRFLGGTVGNVTLAISDMTVPRAGEHGIYFVESLDRDQIHPLYGWSQGHFTLETDETGINRVATGSHQPVTGVSFDRGPEKPPEQKPAVKTLSNGVAQGVTIEQKNRETKALTSDEFKQALRNRLNDLHK